MLALILWLFCFPYFHFHHNYDYFSFFCVKFLIDRLELGFITLQSGNCPRRDHEPCDEQESEREKGSHQLSKLDLIPFSIFITVVPVNKNIKIHTYHYLSLISLKPNSNPTSQIQCHYGDSYENSLRFLEKNYICKKRPWYMCHKYASGSIACRMVRVGYMIFRELNPSHPAHFRKFC